MGIYLQLGTGSVAFRANTSGRRLLVMWRWMGSHFHNWIVYNGVAFSIDVLEWGRIFNRCTRMGSHIFLIFGIRQSFISTVSKRTTGTRMFVL